MKLSVDEPTCEKSVDVWGVSLWFLAVCVILVALPIVAFLSVHWEEIGLSYGTYESIVSMLKLLVVLSSFLGAISVLFSAQLKDGEEKDSPSETD